MALRALLILLTPHLDQFPSQHRLPVERYHAVRANNVPDSQFTRVPYSSIETKRPALHIDEINWDAVPPEFKKEGSDWLTISNPKADRVLDVSPVRTLHHK